MPQSKQHERLKSRERGEKEKPTKGGRLDASTKNKALEIERSSSPERLEHAIRKLKNSRKPQKVLRVPQKDMQKASELAKEIKAKITITNLGKTKQKRIK